MKPTEGDMQKYIEERTALYKRFGYDIEEERRFILNKALPLDGEILEIGTGKGYLAITLAQAGFSFTTVDISEEEQRFARCNIANHGFSENVRFKIENAEKLSFPDNFFDAVISSNLIHHLENPFKVIDEMRRVLKPAGKIVISEFTEEGFAMMTAVHRNDGRHHAEGTVKLSEIKKYLADKDLLMHEDRSKLQEVVVAYKKG